MYTTQPTSGTHTLGAVSDETKKTGMTLLTVGIVGAVVLFLFLPKAKEGLRHRRAERGGEFESADIWHGQGQSFDTPMGWWGNAGGLYMGPYKTKRQVKAAVRAYGYTPTEGN